MVTCECKKCGTQFEHSRGRIQCPTCGSNQVWIVRGTENVILLTLLIAVVLAAVGFVALPPATFGAELLALIVAVPLVGIRFWLWRKPGG